MNPTEGDGMAAVLAVIDARVWLIVGIVLAAVFIFINPPPRNPGGRSDA